MGMKLDTLGLYPEKGQELDTQRYFPENEKLIRKLGAEGMVLLKNCGQALPMQEEPGRIALFGGGAIETVYAGCGSGIVYPRHIVNIYDAFVEEGYQIVSEEGLFAYREVYKRSQEILNRYMFLPQFPQALAYEYYRPADLLLSDEEIARAAAESDTAVYVLSRTLGEGFDRHVEGREVKPLDEDFVKMCEDYYVNYTHGATIHNLAFQQETDEYVNSSYELTETEKSNLTRVAAAFKKTILLLNVGGVIDMSFIEAMEGIDAILLVSYPGMEAGHSVMDVLKGRTVPSAKLTDTWARKYTDNPASATFALNDGNGMHEEYSEGIYVGYRYFDTFNISPIYEFGFGLSYTDFSICAKDVESDGKDVTVTAIVTNTGDQFAGREVVQVYFSAPEDGEIEHPYQELAAFGKTKVLQPGESQTLKITFPIGQIASYSEERAAFFLEKGDYVIRVGSSSRKTCVAGVLVMKGAAVTEQLSNQFGSKHIPVLSRKGTRPYSYCAEAYELKTAKRIFISPDEVPLRDTLHNGYAYDDESVVTYLVGDAENGPKNPADRVYLTKGVTARRPHKQIIRYVADQPGFKLNDVMEGKISLMDFVAQMSIEELAAIVHYENFNDDVLIKYGIPIPPQFDGPTGIRFLKQKKEDGSIEMIRNRARRGLLPADYRRDDDESFYYFSAFPDSIMMAQTFDEELGIAYGHAVALEQVDRGVDTCLAPGLNIHRDPLCGRIFEYYSEDPIVSGMSAIGFVKGIQSIPGRGACIKHMILNSQEADRYYSDSVVNERTIREIYLKGFGMALRGARPFMIMTSYNRINGIHASENFDLCSDVIRGEFEYKGLIRTDGYAGEDHDLSMHAGNEWISYKDAYRRIICHADYTKYDPEIDTDFTVLRYADETIYLGDVQKCAWLVLRYVMTTHTMEAVYDRRLPYLEEVCLESYMTAE